MASKAVSQTHPAKKQPQVMLVVGVCLMWLAVVGSAIAVVYSTHQSRQLTNQLAKSQAESAQLQEVWGQYLLERSAWGSYSRVESLAVDKLNMQPPAAQAIIVVQQ